MERAQKRETMRISCPLLETFEGKRYTCMQCNYLKVHFNPNDAYSRRSKVTT